jgi:uncharacterized membrane protein
MAVKDREKEDRIMYLVAYVLPVVTGVAVYLLFAGKDRRLRFHAVQSVILWIGILIVYFVLLTVFSLGGLALGGLRYGAMAAAVFSIFWLVAWLASLYVGYEAMLGNDLRVPYVTEITRSAV